MFRFVVGFMVVLALATAAAAQHNQDSPANATSESAQASVSDDGSGRHLVPERWWESASAICGVSLKQRRYFPQFSVDPIKASEKFDEIREQGFSAVEIFAPAEGGYSYSGLDQTNYYRIDPELGAMDDFRRLVWMAHSRGLAVITFENLGYCSVDAPYWLKACDDVREG